MRVVGYALGGEGSTLYRTDAGDFYLYPTATGWLCLWGDEGMVKRCDTRAQAVHCIDLILSA
jgi:hypothetical protein